MKKEIITFDQLAALSFLKFVKLDGIDMTLLMKGISDIADIQLKDDSEEYFILTNGTVILEQSYIKKFNRNIDIELFESITSRNVIKYLENINIKEFVLRKIKLLYPCYAEEDLINNFSSLQLRIIKRLYQEGYIQDYIHKDSMIGDCNAIKLTKRGELYLYLIDHQTEIDNFCNTLQQSGYNKILIEAFLITQNLEESPSEILKIDNFLEFCNEFDKNPNINDNKTYSRVKVPEKKL